MREAFERAEVHLQWLKESAFDEQDLARIVGYERCLREWQAATSEAEAEIRRWKARCIAAENGHPQVKEATASAEAKYLPLAEAWLRYKQDMRPETRNDYLRASSRVFDCALAALESMGV